LDSTDKDIK